MIMPSDRDPITPLARTGQRLFRKGKRVWDQGEESRAAKTGAAVAGRLVPGKKWWQTPVRWGAEAVGAKVGQGIHRAKKWLQREDYNGVSHQESRSTSQTFNKLVESQMGHYPSGQRGYPNSFHPQQGFQNPRSRKSEGLWSGAIKKGVRRFGAHLLSPTHFAASNLMSAGMGLLTGDEDQSGSWLGKLVGATKSDPLSGAKRHAAAALMNGVWAGAGHIRKNLDLYDDED